MLLYRQSGDGPDHDDEVLLQAGFRYAVSLTHHQQDAEDLIQQAWLQVMRRHGRVRDRRLVFRVIRNLFLDQYRRRQIVVFEPLDDHHAEVPAADGASTGLITGDLDVLLAGLRAVEREALFLNCIEGYTADEIAQLTRQPRGTVLSLLSRARQKLRRVVAEDAARQQPNP